MSRLMRGVVIATALSMGACGGRSGPEGASAAEPESDPGPEPERAREPERAMHLGPTEISVRGGTVATIDDGQLASAERLRAALTGLGLGERALGITVAPATRWDTLVEVLGVVRGTDVRRIELVLEDADEAGGIPLYDPRYEVERPEPVAAPEPPVDVADLLGEPADVHPEDVGGVGGVPIGLSGGLAIGDASLALTITIGEDGLVVSGQNGRLAPRCQDLTEDDVPTVPRTELGFAWAALDTCLRRVREGYPTATTVTLDAYPAAPFSDVAAVMVHARGTDAAPRFGDILIARP